ncbi:Pectinesterase inhibitor [Camellia lanceoleosa]|uniref:Pectinesterase inhibitor n=1 Tax=Camellia lanceoleosa TaxID=1840588 RepID=A0ACC0G3I6_9ERIC|nr:Pectinesterase inhibitor [Camellia lanceoleosa]
MASFFGSCSMLVSLVFMFMLIGPSFAKQRTKLKQICSKTIDQHECIKLMKSNSRASDADIRGLTEIAIDLASCKARDILGVLNSRYDNRYDTWKDRYNSFTDRHGSCYKNYQDAIRDLEQTKKLFYDGDYKRIAVRVNDVKEEVRDCKNQFENSANYSSDRRRWNKEFEILCDVIKVSSKSLYDDSYSLFTRFP